MTRKDYALIASAFAEAISEIAPTDTSNGRVAHGVVRVASKLAVALGSANPRFDVPRFLKACGVVASEPADEPW